MQHVRGESLHRIRLRAGRHGAAGNGSPEQAGSDPGAPLQQDQQDRIIVQPRVFVLDRHQQPLMPCHPARARELLRKGRARVHRLHPFTIRLTDRTVADSEVDGVAIKIDPGSRFTGIAVVRERADGTAGKTTNGLVSIEIWHRGQQVSKDITSRAALRRSRRCRNLRYRAPRFSNRRRLEGWLAPSLRHRVEGTCTWVIRLQAIAPVTALTMELVRFDMQEMVNPEISGAEYQQGTLAGYEVREYLLEKWKRACAYCGASGTGPGSVPLNIDHIRPRARGGSNRVSNLTLACMDCNQAKGATDVAEFVTDPARLKKLLAQAKAPLNDAATVNSTRWALHRALTATGLQVATGSGGRTKWNRVRNSVPKSHTLDALCTGEVASVGSWPARVLVAKSAGRGSYARTRSDRHGFPRLRLPRTKRYFSFATGDHVHAIVPSGAKAGTYTGRVAVRASGRFNITTATGVVQGISHRHIRLLARADGWAYTRNREQCS
jgi:hypothetical protein